MAKTELYSVVYETKNEVDNIKSLVSDLIWKSTSQDIMTTIKSLSDIRVKLENLHDSLDKILNEIDL